jgi:hypothetical protein
MKINRHLSLTITLLRETGQQKSFFLIEEAD